MVLPAGYEFVLALHESKKGTETLNFLPLSVLVLVVFHLLHSCKDSGVRSILDDLFASLNPFPPFPRVAALKYFT